MMKRSIANRPGGGARLLGILVAGCAVCGVCAVVQQHEARGAPPDSSAAAPGSGALHGAQAMDQQQATLAGWIGASPSVTAPQGIDPAYWQVLGPADNALNDKRVALGRKLYFDTRLSRDGTLACATCHDVSRGFTDRRNASEGIGGQVGRRNSPTTLNAVFFSSQFLDGRADSLEAQAKLPIVNPIEMGQPDGAAAVAAVAGDAELQKAFQEAYGRPVGYDDIGRALAAFERTLVFLKAPYDRFIQGEAAAMSEDAKAGFALFQGKARCNACHQMSSSSPIGSDNRFHNIGVSARHADFNQLATQALAALGKDGSEESIDRLALSTNLSELGRFVVTRNRADIGSFKTSQVRNVGVTAPYMHDGSLATLWDVMDHYNKGGEANLYLDGGMEPLALSEREIDQVVAFLFALTDDRLGEQNAAEMERQKQVAGQRRPFRDDALASRKVFQFERLLKGDK